MRGYYVGCCNTAEIRGAISGIHYRITRADMAGSADTAVYHASSGQEQDKGPGGDRAISEGTAE